MLKNDLLQPVVKPHQHTCSAVPFVFRYPKKLYYVLYFRFELLHMTVLLLPLCSHNISRRHDHASSEHPAVGGVASLARDSSWHLAQVGMCWCPRLCTVARKRHQ